MHFNNLLNKLGIRKIYAILLGTIIILLLTVILSFIAIFKIKSPEEVVKLYLNDLSKQNFNAAIELIYHEEKDQWKDYFNNLANDNSPAILLRQKIWQESKLEFNSQSIISDNEILLRIQVTAPDSSKIVNQILNDMDQAIIDTTDPDIVKVGENNINMALYYAAEHLGDYNKDKISGEIIVKFIKSKTLLKDSWYIIPNLEFHNLISGQIDKFLESKILEEEK